MTQSLPALPAVVAAIEKTGAALHAAEVQHQRNTLADRVWLGVLCLQGKEHHKLPANARGQGRKPTAKRKTEEPTALAIHPQGFLAWLALAPAGVAQPTLYKYMDAARGIGLDAWSTEKEVRKLVAQRLAEFDARNQVLSLSMLAAQGKEDTPGQKSKNPGDTKTGTVQTLFAFYEELENHKDELTPIERDTVINRTAETLRRLTGQEWAPIA